MADELDGALSEPAEVEGRIKKLSKTLATTSEERDTERARADKEASEKAEAIRERDFFSQFSDVVSANPQAKDHKDEILAKVKAGYTTQDATFAVLGAAGKLGQPVVEKVNPAGGSADTGVRAEGNKSAAEMTQEERRAVLMENENELQGILSPSMQR